MLLRGASAEALATLSDSLGSALRGGADAARVGSDLFAVADLLRSEPGLRRVATDLSVDAAAKQELVRRLLEGKVDPASLDLVGESLGLRWTVARDLANSLEHLGEVAVVRSAGEASGRLADELFEVSQTLESSAELRHALSDPARSIEDKQSLVRGLLVERALPATVALVEQALEGTYRTVGVALATYQEVAAQVHGERVATVRVAHPLSDADRQRLTDTLSRQYDRTVHLNVVVDPDVIGGIRVEIGDDVIDGTVASRLDDARRRLAG